MRAIYCSSGDARAVRSLVSVVVVIDRALVWLSFPAVAEEQHIRGTQGFGASNSRALNGVGPDNAEHGVRAFGPGPKSKTHAGFYRSHAWRCAETTESCFLTRCRHTYLDGRKMRPLQLMALPRAGMCRGRNC